MQFSVTGSRKEVDTSLVKESGSPTEITNSDALFTNSTKALSKNPMDSFESGPPSYSAGSAKFSSAYMAAASTPVVSDRALVDSDNGEINKHV